MRCGIYNPDKIIANRGCSTTRTGKPNLSIMDVGGEVLLTYSSPLYGDCRERTQAKLYIQAAPADYGMELYRKVVDALR